MTGTKAVDRRLPIGAEVHAGEVDFRIWAPRCERVEVLFTSAHGSGSPERLTLTAEPGGYFSGSAHDVLPGTHYGFRLNGQDKLYPDPASRFQPQGPHGLSAIVDPNAYSWDDADWKGVRLKGQVLYEMHIGTFTRAGTWAAAIEELESLADLGITLLEVMPVADFPAKFGWGYDGVNLFAPTRLYGEPDDFRRFVDAAHKIGLGVILDVVYNHFGPDGNYTGKFSADYISKRHTTDWGEAINFDGENCKPVREFFVANAGYWIDEFHLDGLRLDAVQAISDDSHEHVLAAIAKQVHAAARGRETVLVVENEFQDSRLLRTPDAGGADIDAAWNDDFHHAARVAMTGHADYYYGDYRGTPQEIISAVKWGYLYQGQWNTRQQCFRGSPGCDLPACKFIHFLQNHDQVGNSPSGRRISAFTSPGRLRAMTAVLLLTPSTPLLFQGQEFGASTPFHYFADHDEQTGLLVRAGRVQGMRAFRRLAGSAADHLVPNPCDAATFEECKLDYSERTRNAAQYALHRDLLRLRREDAVFAAQDDSRVFGCVIAEEAFALRFFGPEDDRLLVVNLGRDLDGGPIAEPLLAPPFGQPWLQIWSSEDPKYSGSGAGIYDPMCSHFFGHAAVLFSSQSQIS